LIRVETFRFGTGEDTALVELLVDVFCGGGYTANMQAKNAFRPDVLANRGECLVARVHGEIVGVSFFVASTNPARQIAERSESEIHLLAVSPKVRRQGIGHALVQECVERARAAGSLRLVLSSQPGMKEAHRLYRRLGFCRNSARDWPRPAGGSYWVFERNLQENY